ncbi:MAG TPA: GntR family transcriptional regulator [Burkholderiales bacterium]|nr:GntR family transcriptional regulator [Burkholderiales bacterium]
MEEAEESGRAAHTRRPTAPTRASDRQDGAAPDTRADWVDRRLRRAILAGELAPGERLVAAALVERFAVSATPLREAMQRLAAQGLIEIEPQRGARVAPVSPRDAGEIYELRVLLDPRALRDSLAHSDDAHRAQIAAAYDRLVAANGGPGRLPRDLVEAVDRHAEFHATLLARCRSRWLLRLTSLLADHSQRYALLAFAAPEGVGHHDVVGEHGPIRDAALAGRAREAARLLEEHLRQTLAGVRAVARGGS